MEELGIQVKVGQKLGEWAFFRPFDGQTVIVTNYATEADMRDVDDLTLSKEHIAAEFVPRANLPELEVKDPSILAAL